MEKNKIKTKTAAEHAGITSFQPRGFVLSSFLLLLVLLPSIHAAGDWRPAVFGAFIVSFSVVLLAYMVVTVLHWEQFKGILHDEAGQAVLTFVLVLVLIGGMPDLERAATGMICGFAGNNNCAQTLAAPKPLNTWAVSVNTVQTVSLEKTMEDALDFNMKLGYVSSTTGFCSHLGVGFGVAGCATYGVLRGPVGQLMNAAGTGLMDLQAENILLQLNMTEMTLGLLLPLGVLLRSLHWTRKAGGTIIALALSLYLVFPSALLVGRAMTDSFVTASVLQSDPASGYSGQAAFPTMPAKYDPLSSSSIECDPFYPDADKMVDKMHELMQRPVGHESDVFHYPSPVEKLIFAVLVKNLIITVGALTATMVAVRSLGHALGAEVDVWAIARLS